MLGENDPLPKLLPLSLNVDMSCDRVSEINKYIEALQHGLAYEMANVEVAINVSISGVIVNPAQSGAW